MEKELWDLYDKDLNHKGTFERGSGLLPAGLYHKTVEVIPTDMAGNMLLTRRSRRKTVGGGTLEFPAGSVKAGETEQEAAIRELREETGLTAKKLYFLQRIRTNGMLRYLFVAYVPDMNNQKIHWDPREVEGFRFVSAEEWMELMTTSEYNLFRSKHYTSTLCANVEMLVNYRLNNVIKKPAATEPKPLVPSKGLHNRVGKPISTDRAAQHYETNSTYRDAPEDWEPIEKGDDGA